MKKKFDNNNAIIIYLCLVLRDVLWIERRDAQTGKDRISL